MNTDGRAILIMTVSYSKLFILCLRNVILTRSMEMSKTCSSSLLNFDTM